MNNILEKITKKDLHLMELLFDKKCTLRELSRLSGYSVGKIHEFVKKFCKNSIIKTQKELNTLKISLNNEFILTKEIKRLIFIEKVISSKSFKEVKKLGVIGLYGSFARGDYRADSDVDIIIFSRENLLKIRSMINQLQDEIKKEINLLVLDDKKVKELKEKDKEFYNRLKYQSVILNGEMRWT